MTPQELADKLVYPNQPWGTGVTYREMAALYALQGFLADPESHAKERKSDETCSQATARLAGEQADDLIKWLASTSVEETPEPREEDK